MKFFIFISELLIMLMRIQTCKRIPPIFFLLLVLCCLFSCKKDDLQSNSGHIGHSDASVALSWADLSLNIIRHAKYNSPTYSSRSLGYLGVTMYESVVYADPAYRSLQGQLNELTGLPLPENNKEYHWPLVLNSSLQTMLKSLYPTHTNITAAAEASIDSLYGALLVQHSKAISAGIVDRSVQFGKTLAHAILQWAKTDGGHEGFLRHFVPTFIFPTGASFWVPPVKGQTVTPFPLHPQWGQNRMFSPANKSLPTPPIVAYSTNPQSEYYKLYKAIYDKSKNLTRTDKEIAAWWADDPTETYSPPGHSFNLATLAIRKSGAGLVKAAETYARVGMAVADAFICCWKTKFTYFNERPSTYIRTVIDRSWEPFWPEPPFPAYPSGHSTQSAAAATVLTALHGDRFTFTDDTHKGAVRFPFSEPMASRNYASFWESAEESGYSRILGGIHTQQDNAIGLEEGKKIGGNINKLLWKK